MPPLLGKIFGLICFAAVIVALIANGVFAALAPERWVRSRWTASGTISRRDLESSWKRVEIRVLGVGLAAVGIFFLSVVIGPPTTNLLFGLLTGVMTALAVTGGIVILVWPEQNLPKATLRLLPQPPATRRLSLLLLRLSALIVLVIVIYGLVSWARS